MHNNIILSICLRQHFYYTFLALVKMSIAVYADVQLLVVPQYTLHQRSVTFYGTDPNVCSEIDDTKDFIE